jgi:hypothetical protein
MKIGLKHFTSEIRRYNTTKYLKSIIKRVNNGEGYCTLAGHHVIFNKYSTNRKEIERYFENQRNNIISFSL